MKTVDHLKATLVTSGGGFSPSYLLTLMVIAPSPIIY